jgi:hypothetical protein
MATGDAINFCLASLQKLNEKIDSLKVKSNSKNDQSNNTATTAGLVISAALIGGFAGSKLKKKEN